MKLTELSQKIQQAPRLDFGDIFSESIELFKKVWSQGLIVLILTMALIVPAYFIIYLPLIGAGMISPELFDQPEPSGLLLVPFVALMMVICFYVAVVGMMMRAAFYRICQQKESQTTEGDNYFYYLRGKYISKLILLSLLMAAIALGAMLLCFLPIFFVAVPLGFVPIVFAFNPGLTSSEIIKASFQLGVKKWWLTFGLMIVAGILAEMVGLLLCGVGIFVTASFSYIPLYIIYKKTIGFEEPEKPSVGIERF